MESLELVQRDYFPNEIKPVKSDKAVKRVPNQKLFQKRVWCITFLSKFLPMNAPILQAAIIR